MSRTPWRVHPVLWAPVILALLSLGTTGCTARNISRTGTPPATSPTPTAEPVAAVVHPTPKPHQDDTPEPPPPPPPIAGPAAIAAINLINQAGTGPAGSHARTGSTDVALTFDDGPDPTLTPKILDLLKANGVKATFCLVGKQVKLYPALVRRIVAEGHTLCDHTYSHQNDLGKQSTEKMTKELLDTLDVIHAASPGAPVQYFRAPGGNFTPALVAVAHSLGLTPIYWAVDPRDWDDQQFGTGVRMVNHIIDVVESKTGPGAIVLSHDLKVPDTITAYATLLPWLKARYTLVCLPVVPV